MEQKSISKKVPIPVTALRIPVTALKSNLRSQNKVLHNNNNNNNNYNNNNNNKENNNIDTGTIPFPNTTKLVARSVYESKTATHLQQYHHSIMGAFSVKTYLEAIKEGWLSSFPGLSVEAVKKHLPKSTQTVMGYPYMICKGICPTPGEKRSK